MLNLDHTDMGHWLAIKWGLPLTLREVIALHHDPQRAKEAKELVSLIHFADILTRRKKIGSGGDNKTPPLNSNVFQMLKLTQNDVVQLMDLISDEMKKASVFFSLSGTKSEYGD